MGSKAYRELVGPCGCEEELKAQRETDPSTVRSIVGVAEEMRKTWGCPGTCGAEPQEPTEEGKARLENIEREMGVRGLTTCPGWYLSQPGAKIAAEAFQFLREGGGGIETCFGRDPPRTLVLAAHAVRQGVNARQENDEERRERERKK